MTFSRRNNGNMLDIPGFCPSLYSGVILSPDYRTWSETSKRGCRPHLKLQLISAHRRPSAPSGILLTLPWTFSLFSSSTPLLPHPRLQPPPPRSPPLSHITFPNMYSSPHVIFVPCGLVEMSGQTRLRMVPQVALYILKMSPRCQIMHLVYLR